MGSLISPSPLLRNRWIIEQCFSIKIVVCHTRSSSLILYLLFLSRSPHNKLCIFSVVSLDAIIILVILFSFCFSASLRISSSMCVCACVVVVVVVVIMIVPSQFVSPMVGNDPFAHSISFVPFVHAYYVSFSPSLSLWM